MHFVCAKFCVIRSEFLALIRFHFGPSKSEQIDPKCQLFSCSSPMLRIFQKLRAKRLVNDKRGILSPSGTGQNISESLEPIWPREGWEGIDWKASSARPQAPHDTRRAWSELSRDFCRLVNQIQTWKVHHKISWKESKNVDLKRSSHKLYGEWNS